MRFSSVLGGVLVSTLLGMSAISYPIVKLVYQTAWYIDDPSYEQSLYNSINIKFD